MRKTVVILLVLLLSFVFVSCNPDSPVLSDNYGYGSLSIVTEKESGSKTVEPDVLFRKCTSYEIFIKDMSLEYETSVITTSKSFVMEEIKAGEYEVYVEGVNESGVHVVSSEKKSVSIRNKTTTEVEFSLNKYTSGTGVFSLTMMVPKNDLQVYGVAWALKGLTDESFELVDSTTVSSLSSDEKYRCYSISNSVQAGSYDLEVVMFDEEYNQVGFTHIDSVHVFRGSTASSAYIWDKEFFPAIPSPSFDLDEGVYSEGQIVRIVSEDTRAELFYTLDGTEPTKESNLYVNPIILTENTEIKAIAYVEGLRPSEPVSHEFRVRVETPVFSIKDQSVVDYDNLSISTTTSGARIFYTLDGSNPSENNGNEYSDPILIYQNLIVKAIAIKENHESSEIITAEYFDVNSPSPSRFFSITSNGAISANKTLLNSLPSVLIIPEEINGIEVVSLVANAFRACSSVNTIVIPNSVSSIGANAFNGCSSISSIDISEFITSIDPTAFNGWNEEQKINDYSGLIRAGSLTNCSAKIYATIKMGTQTVGGYTGMDHLYGIYLPSSVTTIEANAFSGCVNLGDFVMPSYVTSIGELAFYGCTNISQVTLPAVLKSVNYDSFNDWTLDQKIIDRSGLLALQRMTECYAKIYTTIPKSINNVPVNSIPASLSRGRDDIYGLEIPSNVKYIDDYAFEGTNIEEITIPATVEETGLEIFKGWNDSQRVHYIYNEATISVLGTQTTFSGNVASFDVEFAGNFTEIKADAFAGMTSLSEISIPDSVTTIGSRAFKNTSIRTASISDNVSYLGEKCFYGCNKLETVSFGNYLQTIGASAFENCNKLVGVVLPDSITSIGDYCFANCSKLSSVNLGLGITSIPSHAFDNCPLLTSVIAPNCRGSFLVTVKVPVRQLAVNQIVITVNPTYATSLSGYSTTIERSSQEIDGDWRVFTYAVPDMLAIDYTVTITLKNVDGEVVGSYVSDPEAVIAENQTSVTKEFYLSSFSSEPKVSNPVFNPVGGTYLDGQQVLALSCPGSDSIIYTTDGTTPTEFNGTVYSSPLVLDRTVTIKAVGIKEGSRYSDVVTNNYNVKVKAPVFSIEAGHTYQSYQTVELSSDTAGATIRYTLDGTTPNNQSAIYTGPIEITQSCTLKAVAFKGGLVQSDVTSGHYTITLPDSVVVTPTVYELVIKDSHNNSICSVITGETVLTVSLSPSINNNLWTCTWSLDGETVSNTKTLSISSGGITDGYHILQLTAIYDDKPYSKQIIFRYQQEAN